MDIIIAGAGRVGFQLAKVLSTTHNVTVIDRNSEALKRLQESLDILVIHGDIEDPATYKKLVVEKADLFIAVTDLDEANLISTMIADDVINVERKFIRLRNEQFAQSAIKEKLSIAEAIFPLKLTSATVASLLDYPKANNVKHFKYTDAKLVSIRASNQMFVAQMQSEYCRLIGIERKKNFFVPNLTDTIFPNDLVYFFGDSKIIRQFSSQLQLNEPLDIKKCVVFGGGEIGVSVAKSLKARGIEIKLLEKDIKLCEHAEQALEGTVMTINSKYGAGELYEEEGLKYADMMIAATGNDEFNIIKCLEARENGIRKVVAIINEMEYYNLMHALGIVVVRGPKMSAYNEIIERIYSSEVVMERKFCGGKAAIFLRKIFTDSPLYNKTIKPPKTPYSNAAFIVREGKLYPFNTQYTGLENDVIVAFGEQYSAEKLKSWIYGL